MTEPKPTRTRSPAMTAANRVANAQKKLDDARAIEKRNAERDAARVAQREAELRKAREEFAPFRGTFFGEAEA